MGSTNRWTLKLLTREARGPPGPMPDEFLDEVMAHFDPGTQRAILQLYRTSPESVLAGAGLDLGELRCPALVVWGERDPYLPPALAEQYAAALGGPARGARAPGRRALAVAGAAGADRRDRRVPRGDGERAAAAAPPTRVPRLAADRRALRHLAALGAAGARPRGAGLPRRPGGAAPVRDLGARLVRRPLPARATACSSRRCPRCSAHAWSASRVRCSPTWCFERLARRHWDPQPALAASIAFAVGVLATLIAGQMAFALGLGVGLAALLAGGRRPARPDDGARRRDDVVQPRRGGLPRARLCAPGGWPSARRRRCCARPARSFPGSRSWSRSPSRACSRSAPAQR